MTYANPTRALAFAVATLAAPALAEPERLHVWTTMTWAMDDAAAAAFDAAGTATRAPLAGVEAAADGTLFVTTPRWLDAAVPSTFSRVDADGMLHPWPSAEAHDLSNPEAIRNGLGAFVTSENVLWLMDMGWVAGEDAAPEGAQKLIGYDLSTGEEIARWPLDGVAPRDTSFLNDLVVDEARGLAIITDSGNRGGAPVPAALIVMDLATGEARRILDGHAALSDDPERRLIVDGEEVFPDGRLAVGVNGVTLSADGATLWVSLTTGDAIRSISMDLVADPDADSQALADAVSEPIRIGGGSDGIATDREGRIWITNLALNRVEVLEPDASDTRILFEGGDFVWPDSLAQDFAGGMLLSTNRLNSAFSGQLDYAGDDANFAIWRIPADMAPTR